MTLDDINFFEKVKAQISQLRSEMELLSKSKPDNAINKFKLGFINEKIADANTILVDDFRPVRDFAAFNPDDLPTNSDVLMILGLYLDGLEAWRCANIILDSLHHRWIWNTSEDKIKTDSPSRYRISLL